ncbi:sigma-70 family RNA polymerase sigma factor [Lachnospiraceae bacterium 50-23]|nr:sigma-70 family RNA polymerase sigma factor [Dorea sp.]
MKERFSKVYKECRDPVYGYLLYMTKDVPLAEDLSQETFLKIFLGLRRFRGESTVKTWALTVARNTFLSYAKKKKPILLGEQELEQSTEQQELPEDYMLRKEQGILIREVLMALDERDRTVLILRDYEGLSYEEAAGVLGIEEGALKSRLYRARQRFRRLYALRTGDLPEGGI